MPWKLTPDPELYIFTWLGLVGGLLGTVAGILIADYWIIRRTVLRPAPTCTRPGGRYWYTAGWNWRAVVAFVGRRCARGRRLVLDAPGKPGRSPHDGLIPFLKPLADYGWAVGLGTSMLLYVALMAGEREKVRRQTEQEKATV